MANEDLRIPTNQEEIESLIGDQSEETLTKTLGRVLLSMVAIHYGSYAIKHAGAQFISKYLKNVSFPGRKATTIAQDLSNVGKKLDAFSEKELGYITPESSPSEVLKRNIRARAAQHAKRFPYEFIPAAAVIAYTTPPTTPDGSNWNLKTMGETVLYYSTADILLGPVLKSLARTPAAKIAEKNIKNSVPDALINIQKKLDENLMKGTSGARALSAMYKAFHAAPEEQKILTPKNAKVFWKEYGEQMYEKSMRNLQAMKDEAQIPLLFRRLESFDVLMRGGRGAMSASAAGRQTDFLTDWIDSLKKVAGEKGLLLSDDEAGALYSGVIAGQGNKSAFMANFTRLDKDTNWWRRFGHSEKTWVHNKQLVEEIAHSKVAALKNKSVTDIESLLSDATKRMDVSHYKTWRFTGRTTRPSVSMQGNLLRGGIVEEEAFRTFMQWNQSTIGVGGVTNRLGFRKVTVRDFLSERARRTDPNLDKVFARYDDIAKRLSGGTEGKLYQDWLNTAVDKNLLIKPGFKFSAQDPTRSVLNLSFARDLARTGVAKVAGYTKIPLLNFNPLQLFHVQARLETHEMDMPYIGSWHLPTGQIRTPTIRFGESIYQFRGGKLHDQFNNVYGTFEALPGRYKAYSTSATSTIGRLVRNVTSMGVDTNLTEDALSVRRRWLYRKMPSVANALDISESTEGSIGATVRSWLSNAPAYKVSQSEFLKRKFPKITEFARKRVAKTSFALEAELFAKGKLSAEEAYSFVNRVSEYFHPGLPPQVLKNTVAWLPKEYSEARFYKPSAVKGAAPELAGQNITTGGLIDDVFTGDRRLINVMNILEEDAVAHARMGDEATLILYRNLVKRHQQSLGLSSKFRYAEMPNVGQFHFEATHGDEIKRDIISYLLVRPTTINLRGASRATKANVDLQRLMDIGKLDSLVENIAASGGEFGKRVNAEIKGAIASFKLAAYRANYQNNISNAANALRKDKTLVAEVKALVDNFMKFPSGKAWRAKGADPRNATIAMNKFGSEFTYLEKFGSAFERDPLGTLHGVFDKGGTKTGVSMASLHIVNRLRGVLKLLGMDFTEGKYSSMTDLLVGGFVLRRILPGMAAVTLYQYMDWRSEKYTGEGISEELMRWGIVEPSIGMAAVAQATGMKSFYEWFGKVTGEEDRANLLKYATMGPDEMREFWEEGEVPVRRGRWWILSQSQFKGERTQFFIPNAYRRAKSRYQYTWEGGRGPEEEYFSHSWVPTPRYPLAPLNRILDPYWFEEATYGRRPYPITGQFFTGPYGPLSPILNATIGEFIKPTRQMHTDVLSSYETGFSPYGAPVEGIMHDLPGAASLHGVGTGMLGHGAQLTHAALAGANSRVIGQQMVGGATAGQPYGIGIPATLMLMGEVGVPIGVVQAATPPGIWTQVAPMANMGDSAYRLQEMAGIYGFGVQAVRERMGMRGEYNAPAYMPRASEAYGFQSKFWGMQLGGMGDITLPKQTTLSNITFSEIFRRFVPRIPTSEKVNPIPNTVWQENPWLPGPYSGYFEDYSQGDIYSGSFGALRFPGEAYERAYGITPDYAHGMYPYGPIDRLRILSKSAPWSREYKSLNRSVSRMALSPEQREDYETIRSQVEQINQKYQFSPYRFKNTEFQDASYQITEITDEGYLRGIGARAPIKLAGLQEGPALAEALREELELGTRVSMKIDLNRPKYSISGDSQKVLEAAIPGLNDRLIERGLAQETGGSTLSYYARTNAFERMIGSGWESLTHMWNPLTTKFIQRRTSLEDYERTQVYGKDFAPWSEPIRSFFTPTITSVGAKPLWSSVMTGATIGALSGRGPGVPIMATLGGATMGLNKIRAMVSEKITGNAYIPGNVKERWQQEEYMDVLQYVSLARNYSLLRRRAIAAGEQDPETLYQKDKAIKAWMSEGKRNVSASILEKSVFGGVAKTDYFARNPIAAQAFEYRESMAKTVYGAELGGNLLSLQSALPKERRMYFEEFLNAPVSDRERILALTPPLERRIYQAAWGMKIDPKPGLNKYFENHYLPPPDAAIWQANLDWDKVKVRMIERAGERPSEYGYYPQEVNQAQMYPIPVPTFDMTQTGNIQSYLNQILGSTPIQGLSISVMPSSDPGFNLDFNLTRDMLPLANSMVSASMAGGF